MANRRYPKQLCCILNAHDEIGRDHWAKVYINPVLLLFLYITQYGSCSHSDKAIQESIVELTPENSRQYCKLTCSLISVTQFLKVLIHK